MADKKDILASMNKKIGEDLGVEVEVAEVGKKPRSNSNEESRKAYFKKKNEKENRDITKARLSAADSIQTGDSVLDILNSLLSPKAIDVDAVVATIKAENRDYNRLLEEGKLINMLFDSYNTEGDYEAIDGDWVVILENAEMLKYGQENTLRQKSIFLNRTLCVKVLRVEEKRAYVTPAGSTEHALKHSTKELVNNEIARSLAAGKKPVVFGRVLKIRPESIMVNILDADILGFISRANWSGIYTRTLMGLCQEGDYLQFEVLERSHRNKDTNSKAWILGRKNIARNPWEKVNIEGLQVDSYMVVKCMEKPEGKSYWWGVSDRLPGVEVMGDYTRFYTMQKGMFTGLSYHCKVISIEKNTKNGGYWVKVVPMRVTEEDKPNMDSIHRKLGVRHDGNGGRQ